MSKSITDLEKEWRKWVKARAKGLVRGDFPYAEELLEQRKAQAKSLSHYVPFRVEADRKPGSWPRRTRKNIKK